VDNPYPVGLQMAAAAPAAAAAKPSPEVKK